MNLVWLGFSSIESDGASTTLIDIGTALDYDAYR
jgi:hypothetical protein